MLSSSTEYPNLNGNFGKYAWRQDFSNGVQWGQAKAMTLLVRAVRVFSTLINTDTTNSLIVTTSGWNYIPVTDSLGCIATDSLYVDLRTCGCTNPLAFNYDPSATLDDGSCVDVAYGCTDSLAANFDSVAIRMMVLVNIAIYKLPIHRC